MIFAWGRSAAWALPAAALYLATVAAWLPHRHWDPDEFQHAQFAWLIAQGLVPYRDVFEHHPPLWHVLAAPFAARVDPASADSAFAFLVGGRLASLLCSAGLAAATWALARRFAPAEVAALAVALLLGAAFFITKGMELRPDPLCALLLALAALALARAPGAGRPALGCLAAGLAFGAAVMASQKAIMAAPGLVLGYLLLAHPRLGPARALASAAAAVPGALLAVLPVVAWFAAHGALAEFVHHTLLINLGWPRDGGIALYWHLRRMASRDAVLVLLGLAGIALVRGPAARFLLPVLLALAAGGLALPVAQEQYILLALPYAAVWAALAAHGIGARLPSPRLRRIAAAALALLLALATARNLQAGYARTDEATRVLVARLLEAVPPDGTILAGWTPGFAFRRPAWRHFFVHDEVARVIPARDLAALEEGLRRGAISPGAVDADLLPRLPPPIADLLRAQTMPSPTPGLLLPGP